jgi:hypothetical protein
VNGIDTPRIPGSFLPGHLCGSIYEKPNLGFVKDIWILLEITIDLLGAILIPTN